MTTRICAFLHPQLHRPALRSLATSCYSFPSAPLPPHVFHSSVRDTFCPADISSASDSAAAVFIYIMGSLVVCEAGRGITRICVSIWVAFDEAKYSPVLSEAVVFHVFTPPHTPPFMSRGKMSSGYVPDYAVFCVLIGQDDTV